MINHENVGMKRFLRFNTILCMCIYIYISWLPIKRWILIKSQHILRKPSVGIVRVLPFGPRNWLRQNLSNAWLTSVGCDRNGFFNHFGIPGSRDPRKFHLEKLHPDEEPRNLGIKPSKWEHEETKTKFSSKKINWKGSHPTKSGSIMLDIHLHGLHVSFNTDGLNHGASAGDPHMIQRAQAD